MKTGRVQSLSFQTTCHASTSEHLRAQVRSPLEPGFDADKCCFHNLLLPNMVSLNYSEDKYNPPFFFLFLFLIDFEIIIPQAWVTLVGNNF